MEAENDLAPTITVPAAALRVEHASRPPLDQRVESAAFEPLLEFGEFYHAQYRDLLRFLMYAGATKEQAEDAIADAMLNIFTRWTDLKLTRPRAYARRAAFHSFLRAIRRERDHAARLAAQPDSQDRHDDAALSLWEDRQWVAQLLSSLPPRQREVMALIVDGFAPKEIAELFGRTPEAVRQNLLEARKRLTAMVANEAHVVRKEDR